MLSQSRYKDPHTTVRSRKNRTGIVACSLARTCQAPNAIASKPNPTSNPIGLESFHGTRVPPSWSAMNKQTTDARRSATPSASKYRSFSLMGRLRGAGSTPTSFKNINTRAITSPPIGRLLDAPYVSIFYRFSEGGSSYIQKHQRQVTSSVNAPPIKGPMPDIRPNILTTIAMNNGLFLKSQIYVSIPNAPCNRPAAPTPAIARPTMKAAEVGAAAHMTEPTEIYG